MRLALLAVPAVVGSVFACAPVAGLGDRDAKDSGSTEAITHALWDQGAGATHDFGDVFAGDVLEHTFELRVGAEPLTLIDAVPT